MRKYFVTISEAAELLGVSVQTLRKWDALGKLKPKYTPGGHRRYVRNEVERYYDKEKR